MRKQAEQIINSAITAVLPDAAVIRALENQEFSGRVILVAAGKAAAEAVGEVYATHVIPQPDDSVAKILPSFY